MNFSRRRLLKTGSAGLSTLAVSSAIPSILRASETKEFKIFAWYKDAVEAMSATFAEDTQFDVNYIGTYPGNPNWWAKMMAGEKWDFFIPSMNWLQRAARIGRLAPIDLDKVPNIRNLSELGVRIMEEELSFEGKIYGVPWTFVQNPLIWNTNQIGDAPASWDVMWDETYKGRITVKDEPFLAVMIACLKTGQDVYKIEDWDLVRNTLLEQRQLVNKYWHAHNEVKEMLATEAVVLAQATDGAARSLMAQGVPISYLAPQEGMPATVDAMAIPADAENKEAAHAFINHALRGEEMAKEILAYDYAVMNPSAYEHVSKEVADTHIAPSDWKYIWRRFVPPEEQDKMNNLWLEIKAS